MCFNKFFFEIYNYFFNSKFYKMKTLSQILTLGLCLFTFSSVVAQDTTNDYWKNVGANIHTGGQRKVGIGTNSPKEMLHIRGGSTHGLTFKSTGNGWGTIGNNYGSNAKLTAGSSNLLQFTSKGDVLIRANTAANNSWRTTMRVNADGRVSIGADGNYIAAENLMRDDSGAEITDYSLFVGNGVLTEKVKVALSTTGDWADFVFEEDYQLNSLEMVEDFVKENKHLPNVPSAESVVENGLNVAEMDAKLLRQIEELWLHMIELKKENDALNAKLDEQGK